MANETLSQTEIDQLLGRGGAPVAARARPRDPEFVLYDFRRPNRISKDRLRTIEAMYERLAKSLEAWLISRVRRQIELRLQSVEQYSFGEFTLSLTTPCAAFGFDIKNAEGQKGIVDVGHELAYLLVDRFFGGDGQPAMMNRSLTPIERLTVRLVIERVMHLLTEIWQDHVSLDLDLTSFESFPEMVQGVSREDPVLVANIEIAAENVKALLIICLPLSVLEKFFASGDQRRVRDMKGSLAERKASRDLTEASVRAVHVDVIARMPEFQISIQQLMALTPGSTLSTGIPTDTTLEVQIGGKVRYLAEPGRTGNRVSIKLLDAAHDTTTATLSTPTPR